MLSDVPFISPSEVDQLNKLCKLGTFYRDFNNFIRQYGGHLSLQPNGKLPLPGGHLNVIKLYETVITGTYYILQRWDAKLKGSSRT